MERLEHIRELYSQYLAKTISDNGKEELMQFFDTGNEQEIVYVIGELSPDDTPNIPDISQYNVRTKQVLERIVAHTSPTRQKPPVWRWLSIAATIMLIGFAGYYLYKTNQVPKEPQLTSIYGDDVPPGTNRATVTLSDGTVIALSEDKNGIVANGAELAYTDGVKLVEATAAIQYATLATPRGGQYRLTLPDGSKVILNAESSVTYPTTFADKQRKVELKGEAFFDVAENKAQPFVVATEQQQVTVTGTTFNVNAYGDNNRTITTLVTGSVNVKSNSSSASVSLKPGQEAVWSNGTIKTKDVDTQAATGWADGVFVFKYKTLAEILPQLERWYDIQVDIDPIPDTEFYAEINRNTPLSTVLESMEQTSNLRFEIKERRLKLKKK